MVIKQQLKSDIENEYVELKFLHPCLPIFYILTGTVIFTVFQFTFYIRFFEFFCLYFCIASFGRKYNVYTASYNVHKIFTVIRTGVHNCLRFREVQAAPFDNFPKFRSADQDLSSGCDRTNFRMLVFG